jgi:hypothetical protein
MLKRKKDRAKKAQMKKELEEHKPRELKTDIRMISGCEDDQTSADVSNVNSFKLPDPAGRAGGACTATLLKVLYEDNKTPDEDYSFIEVLGKMRAILEDKGFSQIPQLTATTPLDLNDKFDLVPATATGTHRALMIGINYVGSDPGELRGCHNDVKNMVSADTFLLGRRVSRLYSHLDVLSHQYYLSLFSSYTHSRKTTSRMCTASRRRTSTFSWTMASTNPRLRIT